MPKAPLSPYRPSLEDITKQDPNTKIVEFLMSVLKLGVNIPIAGGFYFRVLPFWLVKWALRKVNKQRAPIFHIHPWETYSGTPRLKSLPCTSKFITYYGINSTLKKFEHLLQAFRFAPVREVLGI